ncbi:hypothetical protein BGX34_001930 [Mortierella sp. NVP85]|nr:hypothetical protein BGX34_001930 [Mortierella sp. NVP85]
MTTTAPPLLSTSTSDSSAETPVSFTKRALECPEILYAIGKWIPVFEGGPLSYTKSHYSTIRPNMMMRCCLVSKYWNDVLTPLLWRVHDTRLMEEVPLTVLEKHREHVRIYSGVGTKQHSGIHPQPPMYTQLQELIMCGPTRQEHIAMQMIKTNNHLRRLSITAISLFTPKLREMAAFTHPDDDPNFDENTHSLANPLGHLRSTLEHIILGSMDFGRMELFYLLRTVAKGNLRILEMNFITGTFDLHDITFESLKQLHIWLDGENRHWPYEIIGRSPHLEYLELCGIPDISLSYPLDPLVHIMRGSQHQESLREMEDQLNAEKQKPRQWSRPQLRTLHIQGIHIWKRQEDTMDLGNDPMFLELIQAAGCIYTRNILTHPCSLQELDIPLWVLDDLSRRAIEASSSTLEVLKIKIQQDLNVLTCWKHEHRGRILREILQSCSKLRTVELWDLNEDKDICEAMAGMIGEHDAIGTVNKGEDDEALVHPRLESFTLKSIPMDYELYRAHTEGERRYFEDAGDHGVTSPWVMPEQQWDRTLLDGTGFLLDTLWKGFELFEDVAEDLELVNEGDKLLTRFLRCISPSRKLRDLQLGQLRFTREI